MKRLLIVLDSYEYRQQEKEFSKLLEDICEPVFIYTRYENRITEFFQKTKVIGSLLTHICYWIISLSHAIKLFSIKGIQNYVFINPIVGIFFAAIVRILRIDRSITIAGFLFEEKKNIIYYNLRKTFVKFCYEKVDRIVVYGNKEVEYYSMLFPSLKGKFVFVQYGRDYIYKKKLPFVHKKKYIASGGRSNRDYKTLCNAFYNTKGKREYDCLVATRPECVTNTMKKSGVQFIYGITLSQFGPFIEGSTIFVLPLLNTKISAGHMSMMEAMSLKKPILVTDIPSIRNYVDENQVFFYDPDDAEDLKEKIDYLLTHINSIRIKEKVENAFIFYEKNYSFRAMLKRIIEVVK